MQAILYPGYCSSTVFNCKPKQLEINLYNTSPTNCVAEVIQTKENLGNEQEQQRF